VLSYEITEGILRIVRSTFYASVPADRLGNHSNNPYLVVEGVLIALKATIEHS
jgi:hypothetical protein